MHPSTTLERIADLLEPPFREKFHATIAKFRSLPEDDEYLQVLEAIGFMTMIWNAVPKQVQLILEGANPVQETCLSISRHVRIAVNEAIPSHEDLRLITESLRDHDIALKAIISTFKTGSVRMPPQLPETFLLWLVLTAALVACFWFWAQPHH